VGPTRWRRLERLGCTEKKEMARWAELRVGGPDRFSLSFLFFLLFSLNLGFQIFEFKFLFVVPIFLR
jgi:hypothetical protein